MCKHCPLLLSSHYILVCCYFTDKGRLKFERNGAQPSVALCEQYLRRQLENLNGQSGDSDGAGVQVSITLIGIGEFSRLVLCM